MAKQIDVVGAVVVRDSRVLCAQRGGSGPLAGLWEFPGGKIEPDESPQGALAREIREELGCEVAVGDLIVTTVHPYDFAEITLTTFYCELVGGEPRKTEHTALLWLSAADLALIDWAPADLPAVRQIERDFGVV